MPHQNVFTRYVIHTANETRLGMYIVAQGFWLSQSGSNLEASKLDLNASENLGYQKACRKLNLHENQGTR